MNILSTVAEIGDKVVNMKRSWKEANAMQESSDGVYDWCYNLRKYD